MNDLPIIDSKGTIYVIGMDLIWAALDSTTGREKWRGTANGRAAYWQIKLYRDDMYLVVINMEGYRDSLHDKTIEDKLRLCKGNTILWERRIPADVRIQVRGKKAFVVFKRKSSLVKRMVVIPRHFGKPIGKVSALSEDP